MRHLAIVSLLLLVPAGANAQRPKYTLNNSTQEGLLLQMASQESDDAKKLGLYEEYFAKYPKHEGMAYACGQAAPLYLKAGQFDKVIGAAERGLAVDPLNAPLAYNALQACEQKKDVACIKTWSQKTVDSAKQAAAQKKPESDTAVESWKNEVDFATQVQERADYSLYAAGLQATDNSMVVEMYETLAARNEKSQYLPQFANRYLVALLQTNQTAKAVALAEKEAAAGRAGEDLLLVAAEGAMGANQFEKARDYSNTIIERMTKQPAPQGVDAAAWENKRKTALGRAYWIAGISEGNLSRYPESDKMMRAALPLIESNKDLLPGAYFYLGLANFKMAEGPKGDKTKMADARKYTTLCSQIPGPFQALAQKNLAVMGAARK